MPVHTPLPANDTRGLPSCAKAASAAVPRYVESDVIAPNRVIGAGTLSTLKASFWQIDERETVQIGDPDFISFALNLRGGRVWRNNEPTACEVGDIAFQPFEGARWRFEREASFVQLYIPFALATSVCQCLYERDLEHDQLRTPCATGYPLLVRAATSIQGQLASMAPTALLLDSWALLLSEILVSRLSSHAERYERSSFGSIPDRSLARVIEFVESHLGSDLDLASLASVAAMSPYHFARRFKARLGVSPHAYVLERRIRRAQLTLAGNDNALHQIAATCGFSSNRISPRLPASDEHYTRCLSSGMPRVAKPITTPVELGPLFQCCGSEV